MTDAQIQTLRKMYALHDAVAKDPIFAESEIETYNGTRADALRAALTLAGQRCGTCRHWAVVVDDNGMCQWKTERLTGMFRERSDGCRLGWEAKA